VVLLRLRRPNLPLLVAQPVGYGHFGDLGHIVRILVVYAAPKKEQDYVDLLLMDVLVQG
jgi:hypothetical protein